MNSSPNTKRVAAVTKGKDEKHESNGKERKLVYVTVHHHGASNAFRSSFKTGLYDIPYDHSHRYGKWI